MFEYIKRLKTQKLYAFINLLSYIIIAFILFCFSVLKLCDIHIFFSQYVFNGGIIFICCVCIFKCIYRIYFYYTNGKNAENYKSVKKKYMNKDGIKKENRYYRLFIIFFWSVFVIGCLVFRIYFNFYYGFYVSGVYFLFGLDILFFSRHCFLKFIGNLDKEKSKKISCCYTCPIRGWDMLMFSSPLLFAVNEVSVILAVMIICMVAFSAIVMIYWELIKFKFISNKKNCEECSRGCGKEYNNKRICLR